MTAEARAEAERRYPAPNFPGDNIGLRVGFVEGAEWKGAQDELRYRPLIEAANTLAERGSCSPACGINACVCGLGDLVDALYALQVESSDEGEADGD